MSPNSFMSELKMAAAPDGMRVYAIGDVHGRADLFDRLAQRIEADMRAHPCKETVTVFLGDYVDRGPDSFGVIDRLAKRDFPTPFVALRGNHEDATMRFFVDEGVFAGWTDFGGLDTLRSYGVDVREAQRAGGVARLRAELVERTPQEHRRFLDETRFSAEYGDYFFCHAGVRPRVALERQDPYDLMWIRGEFLDYRGSFGKIVVHGHTVVPMAENLLNRINVDTGAYKSGALTAVALEGAERRFIDTA